MRDLPLGNDELAVGLDVLALLREMARDLLERGAAAPASKTAEWLAALSPDAVMSRLDALAVLALTGLHARAETRGVTIEDVIDEMEAAVRANDERRGQDRAPDTP
jgi:hypothetical protein